MLNRKEGYDVPIWLAEGLACYCEATDNGTWQGIGELNPERIDTLIPQVSKAKGWISLEDLIGSDDWLRGKCPQPILGYAQSWALFRMLMEEHPHKMPGYLQRVYRQQAPGRRVQDFLDSFGMDLPRMQLRLGEYMKDLIDRHSRVGKSGP
jgi:hypothetical protein